MLLCGVTGGIINTFWKEFVVGSRQSLFLYKNEKGELGFQVHPRKKSKVGYLFSKFVKHFVKI